MILTRYKHLDLARNVPEALKLYESGHTLFYCVGGYRLDLKKFSDGTHFYFQCEESNNWKFQSETLLEALERFFSHKGNRKRFLYAEPPDSVESEAHPSVESEAPASVDDEDFGITITVPKGTKVKIIEI